MLENKIEKEIADLDAKFNKNKKFSDGRIDKLVKELREFEEKTNHALRKQLDMIDGKPSIEFVKGEILSGNRETLAKAMSYTDDEIDRMKRAESNIVKMFDDFKFATKSGLANFD